MVRTAGHPKVLQLSLTASPCSCEVFTGIFKPTVEDDGGLDVEEGRYHVTLTLFKLNEGTCVTACTKKLPYHYWELLPASLLKIHCSILNMCKCIGTNKR